MSRARAADDFKTIRTRMEELQREKLAGQPTPATDTSGAARDLAADPRIRAAYLGLAEPAAP